VSQIVLALRWYLALQLFGLAALPLTLRLLRHLPGRGYAFARPLGLLAGGWALWLVLTLGPGWPPNGVGMVLAVLALLLGSGAVLWYRASETPALPSWRAILVVELLFAAAFAGWCVVRAHMPRIETAGGEKWMEIAFLNAILRAPTFPPHDPWLSGFNISYYYFGYVIVAMLTRLSGVPATIAFNLGIATLFALTCSGAYGLLYAMLAAEKRSGALWGGLLGPVLVALTGNLEGLLEVLHARGLFPAAFWHWLDIRSINSPPPPISEGSWLPPRFFWWWQASRVIRDYAPWHTPSNPAEWEVIDEFPAFSFLLGDMHPHLLALPFLLLALAMALALHLRKREAWRWEAWDIRFPLSGWETLCYAVCLGGLGFLNTWDTPSFLFVTVAAFALLALRRDSPFNLRSWAAFAGVLALGSFALYLPFWLNLSSQASGIAPNLFNSTRLPQFLVMFAPLLLPLAALAVIELRRQRVRWWHVVDWTLVMLAAMLFFLLLAVLVAPEGREIVSALRTGAPIPGLEHLPQAGEQVLNRLLNRIANPWTSLMLAALLAGSLLALLRGLPASFPNRRQEQGEERTGPPRPPQLGRVPGYALLLILVGTLLTLAVEFVYLRDNFGTRMNTVFKFYFQAWVLWSVAAAYGLARLIASGRSLLTVAALLLIIGGLVYPSLAIPARAREYGGPPTLDGAQHLYQSHAADFAAIDWLNQNVEGAPVILETPGDRVRAYTYEGRVSAFTGLPTLLGWGGHEHQWRGDYKEPARREPDIETLYTTTSSEQALALLDAYGIRYVYVGPVETSRYPPAGLAKFAQILNPVYDAGGVTIYHHAPE